ncbi:UNVERIFIED_ORG: hypothetical protein J2W38_007358 [Variovorax paradoxus]|nr:hypothetical protein [Variovorax paradoxus]
MIDLCAADRTSARRWIQSVKLFTANIRRKEMHRFLLRGLLTSAALASIAAVAQSRYENPVDGKTYETLGQFRTYVPAVPRQPGEHRTTTAGVTLLVGEAELQSRVKVEELAGFIKAVEARAYPELEKNKAPMALIVQFNCHPGKCEVKLVSQGNAEKSTLQALYDSLSKLAPLKATGEVIFQIEFRVRA